MKNLYFLLPGGLAVLQMVKLASVDPLASEKQHKCERGSHYVPCVLKMTPEIVPPTTRSTVDAFAVRQK